MAKVHDEFLTHINLVAAQRAACGQAAATGRGRQWMTAGVVADPADPTVILQSFPRSEIEADFDQVVNGRPPGTIGEGASLRMQRDLLISLQRAIRMRYVSPVRLNLMAASGQASAVLATTRMATDYVQDLLRAGQARETLPEPTAS